MFCTAQRNELTKIYGTKDVFTSLSEKCGRLFVYLCMRALVSLNELWGHRLSFMFTLINEAFAQFRITKHTYWPR